MVEGHSVHRVASRFRHLLVGSRFCASSPNGRFFEGSKAIDGKVLSNIEAVGKNLFAFFSPPPTAANATAATEHESSGDNNVVVVHVHFGMSGAWSVHPIDEEPETKPTTRLRLEQLCHSNARLIDHGGNTMTLVAHLSAMTCNFGGIDLYTAKRAALGHDPLRVDANPDELFDKIAKSKKSIGQILMDQSYFAGPGNIYRAEILFLAGVYPTTCGADIDRATFDRIWGASVSLLRRGYNTGSILTVDPDIDSLVASRGDRRYIYNRSRCARCHGTVRSWDMSGRTCYACEAGCQPKLNPKSEDDELLTEREPGAIKVEKAKDRTKSDAKKLPKSGTRGRQHEPFISSCARDGYAKRLAEQGPAGLTIKEIRTHLENLLGAESLPPKGARKAAHVDALTNALAEKGKEVRKETAQPVVASSSASSMLPPPTVSAEEAAREKAAAGEHRGVEHVAELSANQALGAIAKGTSTPLLVNTPSQGAVVSESPRGGKKRSTAASEWGTPVDGRRTRSRRRRRLEF